MQSKWKGRLSRTWREWVKPLLVVLIVCGSFRSAIADWNDVPTGSMKPTIVEGDRIFVNKLAYGLRVPFTSWQLIERDGPQRGDVVIFFAPEDGMRMVKRVIGLPGDRIELRNNRVYVNGEPAVYERLDDDIIETIPPQSRYLHRFAGELIDGRSHPMMTTPLTRSRRTYGPIDVPPGAYFVMGDNRDGSRDSRWIGCIQRDRIVGQATGVVLSVDPDRYYLPRWERFFRGLP
ncbi:MAG: signal peptidase I [Planctomycetota bacterium]|jgi:signal peptidase I